MLSKRHNELQNVRFYIAQKVEQLRSNRTQYPDGFRSALIDNLRRQFVEATEEYEALTGKIDRIAKAAEKGGLKR